uniref:Ovule protein n=1 Tax=Steinernema glaseri TaxID=37863 RepID=A0A1I7ZLU2_9BILA
RPPGRLTAPPFCFHSLILQATLLLFSTLLLSHAHLPFL